MAGGAEPSLEQRASRLFDRLETAPQPEDRRQALDALSAMVSEHAVRLSGAEAVGVLLRALADADDVEMKRDVLDVLVDLLDPKVPSSDLAAAAAKAAHNLDAVLEDPSAIVAILGCLELEDQRLRYNAIQLMLVVLAAERGRVQGFLLSNPMGAAAATDLLSDRREVVRNHALLLLAELTKGSTEIGRFVAFQGAFDRLLEIVEEEAEEGGSIILHDALALIATLLVRNPATQRLFAETGGVQKLLPFLSSDTTDAATAKFAPKQLTGSQVGPRAPSRVRARRRAADSTTETHARSAAARRAGPRLRSAERARRRAARRVRWRAARARRQRARLPRPARQRRHRGRSGAARNLGDDRDRASAAQRGDAGAVRCDPRARAKPAAVARAARGDPARAHRERTAPPAQPWAEGFDARGCGAAVACAPRAARRVGTRAIAPRREPRAGAHGAECRRAHRGRRRGGRGRRRCWGRVGTLLLPHPRARARRRRGAERDAGAARRGGHSIARAREQGREGAAHAHAC